MLVDVLDGIRFQELLGMEQMSYRPLGQDQMSADCEKYYNFCLK